MNDYVSQCLKICPLLLSVLVGGCTYMKHVAIQSDYAKLQQSDPTLLNLKHMLDQDTFFVFGQIIDGTHQYTHYPLAIAGFSDQYKKNERVDAMFNITPNTHYGLNLPARRYQLLVMADLNRNNQFEHDEVIGQKQLEVTLEHIPNKVLGKMDIELNSPTSVVDFAAIEAPVTSDIEESIFYPAGSLRPLNDPFFSREMSTLGLYHPAAFLESSPNMFYALEEDLSYKIPVIFVHGINGSPREFSSLIENRDRSRYKPWFFYYRFHKPA
ncbi:lipase family protein [Oleiphilus messinensis]|nr:hypothetical protein [Oleiphilus messinensis]